jgi:lysozyme
MNRRPIFDELRKFKQEWLRDPSTTLHPDEVTRMDNAITSAENGGTLIKEFEGYAKARADGGCEAYPDPGSGGDPWTCGFGSTGDDIKRGTVWTRAQAEARLENDVRKFAAGVARLVQGVPTTQGQFDSLTSFSYNVGLGALTSSTLLKKHKAGDYEGAAAEFGRWTKAAGRTMPGLVRRRAAEAKLYRGQA